MAQEKEKYKNAANSVGECPLFKKTEKPAMVHIQSNFDLHALLRNSCQLLRLFSGRK
jgi:hypothetical protein